MPTSLKEIYVKKMEESRETKIKKKNIFFDVPNGVILAFNKIIMMNYY